MKMGNSHLRDFASHTLCEYAHQHVCIGVGCRERRARGARRTQRGWQLRAVHTAELSQTPPWDRDRPASECIQHHSWILKEEGSHSHLISHHPLQHLPTPLGTLQRCPSARRSAPLQLTPHSTWLTVTFLEHYSQQAVPL